MPATTLTCPGCKTVLKSKSPVPDGKKVKCPKCNVQFVSPGASVMPANAIQDKSRPQAPPPKPKQEVEDEGWEVVEEEESAGEVKLPAKMVEAFKFEESPEEKAAPKIDYGADSKSKGKSKVKETQRGAARDRDDEEDELDDEDDNRDQDEDEDDDRSRSKSKRKKKAKKKEIDSEGSGLLMLVLLIVGVLFVLLAGGGGIGYYIYNNRDKNQGPDDDPLAYVPTNSPFLQGTDIAALSKVSPTLASEIERSTKQEANVGFLMDCKKTTGFEFRELFEYAILATRPQFQAGQVPVPPTKTLILKSKVPFNQNAIRDAARNAKAYKHKGKTFFKINEAGASMLFMPSDRMLILSNLDENGMQALVSTDGKTPPLPLETGSIVRDARQRNGYWFVGAIDSNLKQLLNLTAMAPQLTPDGKALVNGFANAKAVEFSAAFTGNSVTLHLRCACQDESHAARVASNGQAVWDKSLKGTTGMARLAPLKEDVRAAFKEIINNGTIGTVGHTAELNASVSVRTAEILLRESNQLSAFRFGD